MTASYDLKEGKFNQSLKSSKEISEILTCFFEDSAKKASTYKYAMFKSIMDCLKLATNKTYKISFDLLFSRFAEIYWVLVYQYKIPQRAFSIKVSETLAEKIIYIITKKYEIRRKTQYADLPDSIRSELVKQMKRNCSRYVFGALYTETEQILYSFSIDKEWIKVNPQIVHFLDKHGNAIQKQNYQAWGNYYVKIEAVEGKNRGYYQRLLRREFGDNAVLPITQHTTLKIPKTRKKSVANKLTTVSRNDAIVIKRVRDLLSQYPDLGLYLAQICEKLNLDRDKTKIILENAYWCRKEGSRYYYVNISDSDLFEDVLFQVDSMDYDEIGDVPVQESNSIIDSENIMLLNDPEKLIKKLKREKT